MELFDCIEWNIGREIKNSELFEKSFKYQPVTIFYITGMVSMAAGCNTYEPWSAIVIGFIAGFVYIGLHKSMLKCLFDDPLDAVAVHVGGGTLGN